MAAGWFAAGKTLGIAVDLDAGTMLVSVDGAAWADAFDAACAPSAAVGAGLFPALCGSGGVRVRCNWGADAARPMTRSPPSGGYRAVGQALLAQVAQTTHHPTHPTHPITPYSTGGVTVRRRD